MRDALTRKFQHRIALIGDRAATLTARQWQALSGYDEANIAEFARAAGPTLTATKAAAVATGVAYYAHRAKVRPPGISPKIVPVTPDYREPFIAYWTALKNGHGDAAVESGVARAEALARNLAVSSGRLAAVPTLARAGREPRHWVREADGGACEFCLDAANGIYSSAEAADFGHDRCGCSVDPEF